MQTDAEQSGTVAAWTRRDGVVRILAGNLEEGLRDDADRSRHMILKLPQAWRSCGWRPEWTAKAEALPDARLGLRLDPEASALLTCGRADRER